MIQCSECGFSVNELMKFALMQNSCPSCGSSLFSNRDTNLISMIRQRLSAERFSGKLTEELSYDISLFIFNEFKSGIGKSLIDDGIANLSSKELEGPNPKIDAVKREIEEELEDEIAKLTNDGEVVSEEIFSKADRLKKLREQQLLSNPNMGKAPARRGNGFRGVSRS